MRFILQAAAAHAAMAGYLTAHRAWQYLAGGAPNPPAQAPPGLSTPVNTILGWGKWGVLVCGVAGLLICGGKMAIGHPNRAPFPPDGAPPAPRLPPALPPPPAPPPTPPEFLSPPPP